jgi:hypothetical protein
MTQKYKYVRFPKSNNTQTARKIEKLKIMLCQRVTMYTAL